MSELCSVTEVSMTRHDHGKAQLVGCCDDIVILHAAAWLGDSGDSGGCGHLYAVRKGKEGVRGHYSALGPVSRLFAGNFNRVDARGLSAAHTDCGVDVGLHLTR